MLRICNIYCFSTATLVTCSGLNGMFYTHIAFLALGLRLMLLVKEGTSKNWLYGGRDVYEFSFHYMTTIIYIYIYSRS
jgi:hypothetical protein